ncbi:MAG: hypothetical protein ACYCUM_13645 [Solirubrobacteraceae bacterium]
MRDYVNADGALAPSGLTLVENGIEPRETPDARWVTVWAVGDGDGDGVVHFTYDDDSGGVPQEDDDMTSLSKRDFTPAERRHLAREHKALADGSYPIPDKASLQDADLVRTGHGDVAEARKLIARRARELGVPNPLIEGGPLLKQSIERTHAQGDDEDTPESVAAELCDMESARRDETDPETQARMDRAIKHGRRRYAALAHPERAESIAKAEQAEIEGELSPEARAMREIQRRVKMGVPLAKAARDVSNERAGELKAA